MFSVGKTLWSLAIVLNFVHCTVFVFVIVISRLIVVMKWNRDIDHRSVVLSYFLHGAYVMLDKLDIATIEFLHPCIVFLYIHIIHNRIGNIQ